MPGFYPCKRDLRFVSSLVAGLDFSGISERCCRPGGFSRGANICSDSVPCRPLVLAYDHIHELWVIAPPNAYGARRSLRLRTIRHECLVFGIGNGWAIRWAIKVSSDPLRYAHAHINQIISEIIGPICLIGSSTMRRAIRSLFLLSLGYPLSLLTRAFLS